MHLSLSGAGTPRADSMPRFREACRDAHGPHPPGHGPPLVLLHGLGGSRRSFDTITGALAAHRELAMPDLPGFGETPPLRGEPTIPALADAIASFLDERGIDAGGLENDAHQTARGIRSIASDGHVCLSLGERTICEVLAQEAIEHEREVNYPDANHRADFRVGTTLIEYVGLQGNDAYDARTRAKQEIAARHDLTLELIEPKDLASTRGLAKRLRRIAAH